jgi:hypothetical protein
MAHQTYAGYHNKVSNWFTGKCQQISKKIAQKVWESNTSDKKNRI